VEPRIRGFTIRLILEQTSSTGLFDVRLMLFSFYTLHYKTAYQKLSIKTCTGKIPKLNKRFD